jgi:F-type H+-transporting ATPase subunit b
VIKLDWTLFLQFINFMVLMLVLNSLMFKPLRAALRQRRETIDGSKATISDLEDQVQAQVDRYEAQLQEARLQGSHERAALRQAAQQEETKVLSAAQAQATEKLKTIRDQVASEADAARQALRGETELLAKEIATKVLGRAV